MTNFTDNLWRDLAREHGPALALADRPEPGRAPLLRRPRVLAGSTLGLAGAGTALVLALGAATSTPAYAITTNGDGSVQVTINQTSALPQANAKLTAMGIHEQVTIDMASGAAAVSGPVTCTPAPGVSGPPVRVLVGTNGTEVLESGNTGAGTWHLAACQVTGDTGSGNTGNTGAG
ncbi:MAG: hypothetical protein ACRDP5_27335 [Streptosporangiaceae bacterium]